MVKPDSTEMSSNGKDNEQYRKLFIGGLSMQTSDETLKTYYSQYGIVTDCVVMKDPHTRRSRGFGFVTYTRVEDVDAAMNARPHTIDGKVVDPKRAVPREASQKNEANMSTKRLYMSGVRDDHTEQMFEDYFRKYGNIEKVEIIKDKSTGKCRGFGFITFDDYDPVDKCCLDRQHMVGGHRCDVKKALSKEEIAKAQQMDRDRAERGQRSRGNVRGAWNPPPSAANDRWNNQSGGYGGGHQAWSVPPGNGYGAPQWGPSAAPYSGGYGGGYNPGWPAEAPQWGPPPAAPYAPGYSGYGQPPQREPPPVNSWVPPTGPRY